jgi:surface polysaccharide O-acyltransferase-like enzyme
MRSGLADKRQLPGKPAIWGFIFLIGITTFLVRLPWPNGTNFYNLQFCYFPQYIAFFIAGTMAYRDDWLGRFSLQMGKYWGRVGLIGGLVLWATLLALGGAFKGQMTSYQGGLHWQSLGMACWEQLAGVGISLYLLVWFREKFNAQGPKARFFSENAFAVYVFHTPVLITISRLFSGLPVPLLPKFLLLTGVCIGVTYVLCSLALRRIPLLKRIL